LTKTIASVGGFAASNSRSCMTRTRVKPAFVRKACTAGMDAFSAMSGGCTMALTGSSERAQACTVCSAKAAQFFFFFF